jgi:hypothetical protein
VVDAVEGLEVVPGVAGAVHVDGVVTLLVRADAASSAYRTSSL